MIDTMECMSPLRKNIHQPIKTSIVVEVQGWIFFLRYPVHGTICVIYMYVGVRPKFNGNSFKNKIYTELYSELMDYSNVLRVLL